jgi:starch synthase
MIHASLKEKELDLFKEATNTALLRGGAHFADAITFGDESADPALVAEFSKVKGKKTLPYNPESDLTDYLQLYSDLAGK